MEEAGVEPAPLLRSCARSYVSLRDSTVIGCPYFHLPAQNNAVSRKKCVCKCVRKSTPAAAGPQSIWESERIVLDLNIMAETEGLESSTQALFSHESYRIVAAY
jgi:hypothetical protein